MNQTEIIAYCDELLSVNSIKDYCPNGLQVEGDNRKVEKIAIGVSISMEFIKKATAVDADMIITHHGMIWDKGSRRVEGPFRQKLQALFKKGISAAAYHLPLDFHPEIGNNVQLARLLELSNIELISDKPDLAEAVVGRTNCSSVKELGQLVEKKLNRKPLILPFGNTEPKKVVIMTGGAQNYYMRAVEVGADCFLTGEASELNYAVSQEYQLNFISAGHYATEKWGIIALGDKIAKEFGISTEFIEIENPL